VSLKGEEDISGRTCLCVVGRLSLRLWWWHQSASLKELQLGHQLCGVHRSQSQSDPPSATLRPTLRREL
jgi:hypothetical protein